jgi:Uma2 family endonuclease
MTTLTHKKMTLGDYLAYEDGTESRYELVNGVVEKMPSESDRNQRIVMFLLTLFLQQGIAFYCLRIGAELVVSGAGPTVRMPDLMVLSEELAIALEGQGRSLVTAEMPPPLLVVEVVSPNQAERDYRYKRSEYAARGIAEYWVVDPIEQRVTVFELVSGFYEPREFVGEVRVVSLVMAELAVSAGEVLRAGAQAE